MSLLPIDVNTPHARGRLLVDFLKDIAFDEPLDAQLARGDGQALSVGFDASAPLNTGLLDLGLAFEQTGSLDIIWPGEGDDITRLEEYALPLPGLDEVYLVFEAGGRATVEADASFPIGPLGAGFGITTGGEAEYVYIRRVARSDTTTTREVLQQFFDRLRLPYGVREAGQIPEAGEVLAFQYGGYLKLNAGLSWGVTVNKFAGSRLRDLELATSANIEARAGLTGSIDIAGQWGIEVRKGHADGWVRVTVRKHRERLINVAADLGVKIDLDTENLPATPSEFMEALLDLRTGDLLPKLKNEFADPEALLQHVEDGVGGFAGRLIDRLTDELFDGPIDLDSAAAKKVFDYIQQGEKILRDLQGIDARAVDMLEQYTDEQSQKILDAALEKVASLRDRLDLQNLTESAAWEFLRGFLGDDFSDFLTDDAVFENIQKKVEAWRQKPWKALRAFIAARKKALNLDQLTGELEAALGNLNEVNTPEKFKARVNRSLRDLADRLTGKALDTLDRQALREELKGLRELLGKLEATQQQLYDAFKQALNDTYRFELSYSYTQARERTAFIDVEINLEQGAGRQLIKDALYGNFSAITDGFDPGAVRVYPSAFTQKLRTVRHLKLNVLGWELDAFKALVLSSNTTVTQEGNELTWVHERLVEGSRSRKRGNERTRMYFALQLMARGRSEKLVDSVSSIAASYDLNVEDQDTQEKELKLYLRRAQDLGLMMPGELDDLLDAWRTRLGLSPGDSWGNVAIQYQVRYRSGVLLDLFREFEALRLEHIGRHAFHLIVSAICVDLYTINREAARYLSISKMILDPRYNHLSWPAIMRRIRATPDRARVLSFPVTGQATKVDLDFGGRAILEDLFKVEDDYVEAITRLDRVLSVEEGKPVDLDELDGAFTAFARQQRNIVDALDRPIREEERFADPFFAILDQYIRAYRQRELNEGAAPEALDQARASSVTLTFERGQESVTVPLIA